MVGDDPDNQAFKALSDPYRRQLLFALFDANPQEDELDPLNLLAEGETIDDLAVTRLELKHLHLPKLVDMGLIERDSELGDLSKGPNWEEIGPLLRLMHEHRDELPDELLSGLPNAE